MHLWLLLCLTCFLRAADQAEAPKKDTNGKLAILMTQNDIEGTILWRSDSFVSQQDTGWSEHKCYIGYPRESEVDGKHTREIVPILVLPPIENDMYEFNVRSGVLKVTTTNIA